MIELLARLLFLLGGLLAAAGGCNSQGSATAAVASSEFEQASVERVTAGTPKYDSLQLFTSQPARIAAFETAPLFAKLAGFAASVKVDIGDRVKRGQLLIQLEIPELHDDLKRTKAEVDRAAAEIRQAEMQIEVAKAAATRAQSRIVHAEAGVGRAEGDNARWQAEAERVQDLAQKGSVTPKLADETQNQSKSSAAALREAVAAVESARAALVEAEAGVRKAEADRAVAEAQLQVAEADFAHASTMVAYTEIKAPFDGVITQRTIDTGHFVRPAAADSARPLLTVARTDKVRVCVDVPELEAAMINIGSAATIRVQALPGRDLLGHVNRTSWSLDSTNRCLRVEIDVANSDSVLRPGMYATASILLARRENALTLPKTAIFNDGDRTYCNVVDGSQIERQLIEVGLRSGSLVEILAGITPETKVVLARTDSLKAGQRVEIIPSPE